MPSPPALQDYLADLLVEQQRLQTPVARFAALHDSAPEAIRRPALIPLSAPRPGEQYAFEVNLDSCTGCKACVAGCHSLNGLDEEETWRDTGVLLGGDHRQAFHQTITTACHHCADPACLNGCPVLAYDKDPLTGIVRHLDDQCIGCSYCILKCPYDVPKFSSRLGIVRKCDMCHQRLAAGEAPACVQACPTHAIKIVTVSISTTSSSTATPTDNTGSSTSAGSIQTLSESTATPATPRSRPASPLRPFLPGAADPAYTRPTTRFVTTRDVPANAHAADQNTLRPQPAHWPLVIMLVCTQVALGLQLASSLHSFLFRADSSASSPALVTSLVTNSANPPAYSLTAAPDSVTKLVTVPAAASSSATPLNGTALPPLLPSARPLTSPDSVTKLVTLSLAPFSAAAIAFAALGLTASVAHLGQPFRAWRVFLGLRRSWLSREAVIFGAWFPALILSALIPTSTALATAAAILGLTGVFCSAMIYVDTRRIAWQFGPTAFRFFGTVALAAVFASAALLQSVTSLATLALVLFGKLLLESRAIRPLTDHDRDDDLNPPLATARLLTSRFRPVLSLRIACPLLVLVSLPALPGANVTYYVTIALGALLLIGEFAERYLYFRTVDAPKMPGYAARA